MRLHIFLELLGGTHLVIEKLCITFEFENRVRKRTLSYGPALEMQKRTSQTSTKHDIYYKLEYTIEGTRLWARNITFKTQKDTNEWRSMNYINLYIFDIDHVFDSRMEY